MRFLRGPSRVRKRPLYYGWVLVWALGLTTIVSYGTTQYLFGVLVVPIERDLGWSRASLSGAFSIAFVVSGVLGLPIGRIVDQRGARALMATGSLLGAVCLGLLSMVTALWQFYALWAGGLGLAMALTFYPVTFTVITNWFNRRRGSALALLTLVGGFASVIFYPLGGALIAAFGWRHALLVMAACQLAICLPINVAAVRRRPEDVGLLPHGEPAVDDVPPSLPSGHSFRAALRTPAFWTLTVASGLALMGHAVVLAHQVPYLIGRGFDPVFAAGVAGLLGIASLPSRLVLNLLSDRLGARSLLLLSTLLQAAGVVLLMRTAPASPAVLWVYIAVYGFAFGAVSPLRASVMADQFGRRAYGAITAAQGVPVSVLAGVGPVAAGLLYDRSGRDYSVALILTAIAFAVAALAVAVTPRASPASPSGRPPAGA